MRLRMRSLGAMVLAGGAMVLAFVPLIALPQERAAAPVAARVVSDGQRIFICGHSFHFFIAEPLAALAKEAGLSGHATLGVDFIGNSRPIRHWDVPDERNRVKRAIRTGEVDVLTLAPNREVPDEGIDRFADLAIEHNPDVRVLLQLSWAPFDGKDPLKFRSEDRDRVTADEIAGFRASGQAYLDRLRDQVRAINERHKRTFVFIVPVGVAVARLREAVIAGRAPGIAKQSELFKDPNGHGNQPLKDLVTFCWFAAVYQRSPVGLSALDKKGDETSRRLNRLLQQIAWESVTAEPLSGVKGP